MVEGDIFREVEEEMRRERIAALWERYGTLIIAVAAVIVAIVGGNELWKWWSAKRAAEAGTRYEQAAVLLEDGKTAEAETAFAAIAKDGAAGYPVLAKLQLAAVHAQEGRIADAVAAYDEVAKGSQADDVLRSFAQIRAAQLRVDEADFTEMQNRLNDVSKDAGPYRNAATELLGLAAYRAGKFDEAEAAFTSLLTDSGSARSARQRAEMMLSLIVAKTAKTAAAMPAGDAGATTGSTGGSGSEAAAPTSGAN